MIELNPEQTRALEAIKRGGNYLITGGAGTGKSTLLRAVKKEFPDAAFAAPTAAAARLIGGSTLHRLFQLPPLDVITPDNLPPVKHRKARRLIRSIKTLVIDEISMVRSDLFAAIDYRLREYNPNPHAGYQPFGGRQLILCGDFLQLPPVLSNAKIDDKSIEDYLKETLHGVYVFSSALWDQANITPLYLRRSMRQENDAEYVKLLNAVRLADTKLLPEALQKINQRVTKEIPETAVHLCTRRIDAKSINESYYAQIEAEEHRFEAVITGNFTNDFPIDQTLRVKCGERVLVTANLSPEVVNGTTGTIQSISDEEIRILLDGSEPQVSFPVKRFEYKRYSYKVVYDEIEQKEIIKVCESGSFLQFPLLPAWAITVHRAQGMTINQVALDIHGRCFLSGQCYVALSRCRSLDDLFLETPLEVSDIIVEPEILAEEYYLRFDPARFAAILRDGLLNEYTEMQLDFAKEWSHHIKQMLIPIIQRFWDALDTPAEDHPMPEAKELFLVTRLYYLGCDQIVTGDCDGTELIKRFKALINLYWSENSSKTANA